VKRRLTIAFVVIVAAAIAWAWFAGGVHQRPRVYNGPMVQMLAPEGFELAWQISPDQQTEVVVLAEDGATVGTFAARKADRSTLPGQTRWQASVRGLYAGTAYRYRIVAKPRGGEVVAAEHRVHTAPRPGEPFRFLVIGDSGSGQRAQRQIARLLPGWAPDFVLHAGDLITPAGERELFPTRFFRPYADLMASSPIYACLGNHDYLIERGQPLLDTFLLPSNGPPGEQPGRHWWFDFGGARFVAVDSNHDYPYFRDTVAPWLDKVLAGAGDRWKICLWHEPVYTNGDHYAPAAKLLMSLVPVVEKYHCSLVFSGHQHLYERSWPIRDGKIVGQGEGTVYIVTGAGGCNLYQARSPQSPFIAACRDDQNSFTAVDVTSERLALRQIGADGHILDEYQIDTRKRQQMPRPQSQSQGAAETPQ